MHGKCIQTRQGQAWDQIAHAEYGAENLLHTVLAGNADEADVLLLSGNVRLAVPEVETNAKQQATALLPPWERL